MNTEQMLTLILRIAAVLVALWYFYDVILRPNIRGAKNRRQPTITTRATVVGRDKNLDNVIYSGFYTRDGGDVHFLRFRTEGGDLVNLTVPRILYNTTPDGTTGTLTYQGTKCERFDADEAAEK